MRPALLALPIFAGGCAFGHPCDMRFERLTRADRVVIASNLGKPLRTVADTQLVGQLVRFAVDHGSDWGEPWYGTPVPLFRADFYRGSTFLGHLGVGSDFLEPQGCGGFQSRSLTPRAASGSWRYLGSQIPTLAPTERAPNMRLKLPGALVLSEAIVSCPGGHGASSTTRCADGAVARSLSAIR
jgi:hypothetical protein